MMRVLYFHKIAVLFLGCIALGCCVVSFARAEDNAETTPAAKAEDEAFQKSIEQLCVVQQAIAKGKLAEAKAACSALLEMKDAPAHHRLEAEERLQEIERVEKGLPARDPKATRVALPQQPKPAATFFVAADGDNANPGDKEKPFRTLEHARDAVRALKQLPSAMPAGGVEVCIRGGEYKMTQSFVLESQDSGTEQSPIVYRAFEGETPVFSGGIRLSGFVPVGNAAILERLPEESRGKVLCLDLKPLGVKDFKPFVLGGAASGRGFNTHPTQELFFDGRAMPLSRWPNQGFVKMVDIVEHNGEEKFGNTHSKTGKFIYDGDRPERWAKETDAWLYGYWCYGWADSYEHIQSIDTAKHEIELVKPYHNYGYRKGQTYCAVNLLAEIDMPGEWYLDRVNSILYFWPPSDPAKATIQLSLASSPFVTMQKVSHVSLQGLTWELGGADAIHIKDGAHCLIAGCTIRRCAGLGVSIHGGTDHGILSCDIYSMGRGGVTVDSGDRKTLTPARIFVENCNIYDLSRIDHTYTPAIGMRGVGNRIAHNSLHDIASSAINMVGNNHMVEYNDVYRVVLESDDQGGVDSFGDPTYRGSVIRYNNWKCIGNWRHPDEGPDCGQGGIRLDDAISGVVIYGNIFYRASAGKAGFGGVQIHGGKDNIIDNNIFADCRTAISFSPWDQKRWKEYAAKWLDAPAVDRDLYLAKYPELATLLDDINRNTVARSIVVQCHEFLRRNHKQVRNVDNLAASDNPGFRDLAHGDFHLPENLEPVAQIGFRPIPVDEIGMYTDAFRKELPAQPDLDRE
jgi:hypothetical protein